MKTRLVNIRQETHQLKCTSVLNSISKLVDDSSTREEVLTKYQEILAANFERSAIRFAGSSLQEIHENYLYFSQKESHKFAESCKEILSLSEKNLDLNCAATDTNVSEFYRIKRRHLIQSYLQGILSNIEKSIHQTMIIERRLECQFNEGRIFLAHLSSRDDIKNLENSYEKLLESISILLQLLQNEEAKHRSNLTNLEDINAREGYPIVTGFNQSQLAHWTATTEYKMEVDNEN